MTYQGCSVAVIATFREIIIICGKIMNMAGQPFLAFVLKINISILLKKGVCYGKDGRKTIGVGLDS